MNGEVTLTVAGARTQEVAETVGPSAASGLDSQSTCTAVVWRGSKMPW